MRNLKVAAVQLNCKPLSTMENLEHAEPFIEQAVSQGAELVLLPELMPGGYLLTEEIWKTAERFDGPSVAWLKRTAKRHAIHSAIADSDGVLKAQLGADEDVICAEVHLDPARKAKQAPKAYGRWALPVPWYAFLWPLSQKLGERAYAKHHGRARLAYDKSAADGSPSGPADSRPVAQSGRS